MKFVIDAQLPPALARWISERSHEAEHVAEIGMIAATDAEIANYAQMNGCVLISKDEDFATLRLPDRFGLLWVRCGNTTKRALLNWLQPRWSEVERLLAAGERFIELR